MTTNSKTRTNKLALIIGGAIIAAIWLATFAALALMQPDLKTRMVILAVGAGSTELVLYAGAAWFGINIFNRFRSFLRHRGE
ncbi:hypothetical protein [Alteraurantiacibacter aquimixticola]|uniref:Uncharacterized protein n=1 Tax=Alteraurantiacibacter aquimixticola TaxID=2489173 RepID=A0A4T3F2P1_9SPHN|nr:hypothetical protein [Alteraurantiacibacter aquimixticola]TIX49695.1 hypothetical protein E5222_12840 [Alteraurantiacibacter aquimixticola]